MVKVAAYFVTDAERPYFEKVKKELPLEFTVFTSDNLTMENVHDIPDGTEAVSIMPAAQTTREILEILKAKGIKTVGTRSAGLDSIDLVAAKELGIKITNVPAYSPQAIAEFTVMLILMGLRDPKLMLKKELNGDFSDLPRISHQLDTRIVGILGYGYIGQAVAKLLQPFGCKIIVYVEPQFRNPETLLSGMEYSETITDFFKQSNVITLHCPSTPDTYHLVNAERIALMTDGIIINTARGPIVDAKAVLDALDSDELNYYATDVYEYEQGIFHRTFETLDEIQDELFKRLLRHPKTFVTPHVAFNTFTSVKNMVNFGMENAIKAIKELE